ncbi:MAG: hypothetical protein FWH25_00900, partial [Syntrophorhabdaceae bacterium]|nr:hypothetical protein [Syntrophorhabdaceae bacterium]
MTGEVLCNARHGVFFRMRVLTPKRVLFVPGQFAMLSGWQGNDPLLPRPLAILSAGEREDAGTVEFLYKVVGRGTMLLSALRPGDSLSLVLPLGNGFRIEGERRNWWLLGGGVGLSTLFPAADALAEEDFHMFLGARCYLQHPPREWISGWEASGRITLCTDNGTLGYKGTVGAAVREQFKNLSPSEKERVTILACGPWGMLKDLAETALSLGIPAQVSL